MKKLNKKQKSRSPSLPQKKTRTLDLTGYGGGSRLVESGKSASSASASQENPCTIRLDTDIIDWLKSYGRGYQTKQTNMLLRHAMRSSVQAKANKREPA